MKKTNKIFAMILSMAIVLSSVVIPNMATAKIRNAEQAKKLKTAKLLSTSSGLAKKVSKQDAMGMFYKGIGEEAISRAIEGMTSKQFDKHRKKEIKKERKRLAKKIKDIKKVKDKNIMAVSAFYSVNAAGIKNKKINPNAKITGNEYCKYLLKVYGINVKENKAATRFAKEFGLSQSYAKNLAKRKVTKDDVVGIIWAIDNMEVEGYKYIELMVDMFGLDAQPFIKAGLYPKGEFTIQDVSIVEETGALRINFDTECVNNDIANWDLSKIEIYVNEEGIDQEVVSVERFKAGTAEYIGTLANYSYNGNKKISVKQSDFVKPGTEEEFTVAQAKQLVSTVEIKPARLSDETYQILNECINNGKGIYLLFYPGAIKSVGEYNRFTPVLVGINGNPTDEYDYFIQDYYEMFEDYYSIED